MATVKTDNEMLFQRAVGLKAIASKAEELKNEGYAPFEVQSFINGARGRLAQEAPDPEMYHKALRVAAMHKEQGNRRVKAAAPVKKQDDSQTNEQKEYSGRERRRYREQKPQESLGNSLKDRLRDRIMRERRGNF